MNDELKPCPFCGGKADTYDYEAEHDIYDPITLGYVDTEHYTKYGVACFDCECMIAEKSSIKEAVNIWNTRAKDGECYEPTTTDFEACQTDFD